MRRDGTTDCYRIQVFDFVTRIFTSQGVEMLGSHTGDRDPQVGIVLGNAEQILAPRRKFFSLKVSCLLRQYLAH